MKKTILLLLLTLVGFVSFAQPSPDKLKGSLSKGKIVLNKKEITKTWRIQTLLDAVGTPKRTRDGYNKTHTYDNYGIVGFEPVKEKVNTGDLSELQIYFSQGEVNNVSPTGFYTGSFKVEKIEISKDLSYENLKEKIEDYILTESYTEHSYRYTKKGIYIYFQFSDDEQTLIKISMGKDKSS